MAPTATAQPLRRRLRRVAVLAALCLPLAAQAPPESQPDTPAAPTVAPRGSWLERLLEGRIPGLRIEGLEGVFRATPTARRVTLADRNGVWLTMEEVRIALAPTALLRGVARIQAFEAARIVIDRPPIGDPAAPPTAPDPNAGVLPALPSLPVDLALDRLAIARLELGSGLFGTAAVFEVTGRATLGGNRLTAGIGLQRLDGAGLARIDLALDPAANRLAASIEATEPPGGIGPTLVGLPDRPMSLRLRLDGPASGAALDLAATLGADVSVSATGTVRAGADGSLGAALTGEASAGPLLPPDAAPLATPAGFVLDAALDAAQTLTLTTLRLALPAGNVAATGTAALGGGDGPVDLRATLALAESARFAGLLPPGLGWSGVGAEATVSGTVAAPRLVATATAAGFASGTPQADALLGPTPRLLVDAALPGPTFDVRVEARGGVATARGIVAPLDATVTLALPDLALLGAGLGGALDATARATGTLEDPTVALTARSARLEAAGQVLDAFALDTTVTTPRTAPAATARATGRFGGLPLDLALDAAPEGDRVRLREATARLGPAKLEANGAFDTAAQRFDGTARLAVDDLAPLGRLGGVEGLAGRLSLTARLAPRGGAQGFDVRLDAPSLGFGGNTGRLEATAAGTPADLEFRVAARGTASGQPATVTAQGRATETAGERRLAVAALSVEAMGERLALAGPARVTLGADGGVQVAPLALVPGRGGRLEAQGRWGPERADVTLRLAALPAALATPFAPDVQPQGTLSGDVRITGAVGAPEFRAALRGEGLRAGADWARGLPTLTLRADASGSATAAQLRAEVAAGPAGRVVATASLPRGFGPAAPLTAQLEGALVLAPLAQPFLAGGADRVTGRLALALRADGTLGTPRLGGRATLSEGSYRNPATGVRLSDIAGSVVGDGTRLTVERLGARTAGEGTLGVTGNIDFGAPGLPADLRLVARDAQPVASQYGTATLGADLRVSGPLAGGARVAGEIRIVRAELRVPETLPASVPVITPVRIRGAPPCAPRAATVACAGQPPPPPASGPPAAPIALDVRLIAPGRVFVRGRGLDAELGGEIRVGGTLAAPTADGGFRLRRGTLEILARRLNFSRGVVDFDGGTLTPRLDFLATAPARGITVTVAVTGSPAEPKIVFASSPELPQDEVVARLLFDRPTSGLSAFELAQLAQAVAQLTGVGGGFDPFDRVRGALGLDRLGIGGGEGNAGPAIEAGRYVAPGVFVGVRQGVQGGQPGVGVQVEITPEIKLDAQTATGAGGDRLGVTYELEY